MKKLLLMTLVAVAVLTGCEKKSTESQNATIKFTRADISGAEYLTLAQDPATKADGTTEVKNTLFKIDDKGKMTAVTFYVQTTYDENGNQTGEVDATANYSVTPREVMDYGEKYVLFVDCYIEAHSDEAHYILYSSVYGIGVGYTTTFLIRKTDGAIFRINPEDQDLFPDRYANLYGDRRFVYNAKGDMYMAGSVVSKLKLENDKLTLQRLTQNGSVDALLLDKYDNFYGGGGGGGFSAGSTLHFANGSLMKMSGLNGCVMLIDNELYCAAPPRDGKGKLTLYKLPTVLPADPSNPNYEMIATIDYDPSIYHHVNKTYESETQVIIYICFVYDKATKTLSKRDYPEEFNRYYDDNGITYELQDNGTEIIRYNIFDLTKTIIRCDRSAVPPCVRSWTKEEKTEFIEYSLKNSDGSPIRIHTDKETGKVTVYEDPDKRTITELIKVS